MTIYRLLDLKKARSACDAGRDSPEEPRPKDEYYCTATFRWFPWNTYSWSYIGGYYECKTVVRRPVTPFPVGDDVFLDLGEKLVKLMPEFVSQDPDQTYANPTEIVAYLRRIEAAAEAESQSQKPCEYVVPADFYRNGDRFPSRQMKMTIIKARSGSRIDFDTRGDPWGYRSHATSEIKIEKKTEKRSVDPYVEHRQRLEVLGVEKRVEVLIDPLAKPTLMVEIQYEDFV